MAGTGSNHFDALVAAAPVTIKQPKVDWRGISTFMNESGIDSDSVLAVSWSVFGTANIEALIDPPTLAIIHRRGVLSTAGKKSLTGKPKAWAIDFDQCRGWEPTETVDERNYGKYCIDFYGAGNVGLGRLEWRWDGPRFRDPREKMLISATERDRILDVLESLSQE